MQTDADETAGSEIVLKEMFSTGASE